MRAFILSFLLITLSITLNAQIRLKGRVLDNKSGLPVGNASIYINNTSIGTITNIQGEFTLSAKSIYTGELIVSSVGYQPLFFHLDNKDTGNFFYTFKLNVKENTLKEILIMNDATRQQRMKIFRENFLGITEEADNCSIENPEAIYFTMGENKGAINAYADTPLVIVNKQLGYKVTFDLVEFGFDKQKNSTYFFGYSRYEEMGDKKKWLKRRRQNYLGSTMHFYRSLTNGDLKKEGFAIFGIRKKQQQNDSIGNQKKALSGFAVAYPVTARDILLVDSLQDKLYLQSVDQVMVQYNEVPHSKPYLAKKVFIRGVNRFGFTAYISLLTDKVELDKNGIVHSPLSVIYDGFWVYEKFANQLPFDYQPD